MWIVSSPTARGVDRQGLGVAKRRDRARMQIWPKLPRRVLDHFYADEEIDNAGCGGYSLSIKRC